ncbi:MAG: hypothetical protein IPK25_16340 [Saprospiraceae bacterium]|nr:hypothetical protein [Saprospiraceae bacterium]
MICTPSGDGPFTFSWSGSNLNNLNSANPVFTPSSGGVFTFSCTVTNSTGCQTSCSIDICVIDVRVSGRNTKVKLGHASLRETQTMRILLS